MLLLCPRCASVDVHASRVRGPCERLLAAAGLSPRRCAACGWRGWRPRGLFPLHRAPAVAPEPGVAASPAPHRSGRRRHASRRRGVPALAVLLAAAVGVVALVLVGSCGG